MSRDFDILVVGAGVAGSALAASLVARKAVLPERIALIADRFVTRPAPDLELDLRVFAMSRASQRLLTELGIWQELPRDRVNAYDRMCVWDARDTPDSAAALRFDCAEIGEPDLGTIVEGRALQWLTQEAARRAGVTLIQAGVGSVTFADAGATLTLNDSRPLRAELIVAADGVDSALRPRLQIDVVGHSYHQQALVAHVHTQHPHRRTAWQRFLPTGPLALLPLGDGRSSIVWSVEDSRADALMAMTPEDFNSALTEASGEVLGRCRVSTPRARFPLQLKVAADYVRPRFALLGDAAHAVHPLAGQGLNLGLQDCTALADVLASVRAPQFGDLRTLRRYERARKSENLLAATAFDGLNRLFSNSNPFLSGLRSAGLGSVGRVPALRRFFARTALGI